MHLLFDLDGTLTDSREGITRCYQHALVELGYPAPADEEISSFVGPPLAEAFRRLMRTTDAALVNQAIAAYRRRFEPVGMFENQVYPGIVGALEACTAMGCTLSVVTAKPSVYAKRILDHFALTRLFLEVYGSELDDRQFTKTRLIQDARAAAPDLATTVMIGDRADDARSAREAGVLSLAVTWGYADPDELTNARPDYLVGTVDELVECVRTLKAPL